MENMVNPHHTSFLTKLNALCENRKILITGGGGFTGIWLSTLIDTLGADVVTLGTNLTRTNTPAAAQPLTMPSPLQTKHLECDIRSLGVLQNHITQQNPEIIIHLAAQPLVLDSYKTPYETLSSNATGTLNIIEAARHANDCKLVLVITSDKVYQNDNSGQPMQEGQPLLGSDPYSSSKVAAEAIALGYAQAFHHTKGPRIAIARAGNIIGGGDWSADRLVPDFARAIGNNARLSIRSPYAVRPWQHVLDAAVGYLLFTASILENNSPFHDSICPAVNLGPLAEDCITVKDMITHLGHLSGTGLDHVDFADGTDITGKEKHLLQLDTSLAKRLLGWEPKLRIKPALEHSWAVYRSLLDGKLSGEIVNRQVAQYLEALDA